MIHTVKTISEMHRLLGLPKPKHPLVSVMDLSEMDMKQNEAIWQHHYTKFYTVSVKTGCVGKVKYGQNKFDFDDGTLVCMGPNQIISTQNTGELEIHGFALTIDPDFLLNHPLAKKIQECDFFSYQMSEALHLSDEERQIIFQLFQAIKNEYDNNMDGFSQEVLLSNIELLLVHINRYYSRQFITRKNYHNDLLSQVESLLAKYYDNEGNDSLPTVNYLADHVHMSPAYLSDMLKNYTGLSAQQHIHETVIHRAKELLTLSELSVSQIAYELGFQHPQSFSKLFKQKTNVTPLKFRESYM